MSLATDDGLLKADSSIWETHWDNGARQHWTWSQIWGSLGLKAAAALAVRHGQQGLADRYAATADSLRFAIHRKLIDPDGFLRGRLEQTPVPEDAAVIEAFCRSLIDPSGPIAQATLARLKSKLTVASGHGYRRNLGPSDYDAMEWIVIDMRMANALRWAGLATEAEALIRWVTDQSRRNFDLIAENYSPDGSDYSGAIPMIGFGAGAYVLALFARSEAAEVAPPGPDAGTADATSPGADTGTSATTTDGGARSDSSLHVLADAGGGAEDSGCGCEAGGLASGATLVPTAALLAGLLRARRRR
ncbi:MAG: hypothetical protein HY901_30195 [Deltaproteobacteria bacterium]|nr:hypothetical protein [Deltaproteobacteria bacterium]